MFQSLFEGPYFISFLQILLDVTIIVFLVVHFARRPKVSQGVQPLTESLGRIIEETNGISEAFDKNLQERQILIQNLLAKLDQRLQEAQQLCTRLEGLNRQANSVSTSTYGSPARVPDTHEILRLARNGLTPASIAKRLKKPIGEIELVLSLERISPER